MANLMQQLRRLIAIAPYFKDECLVTHPDNLPLIRHAVEEIAGPGYTAADVGIDVRTYKYLAKYSQAWRPPTGSRYIAYGKEDEHWMRPLGLGCFVNEPVFYVLEKDGYDDLSSLTFLAEAFY
jgi:hypothetical protein